MSADEINMKATLDASGFASGMQQVNSQLGEFGIRTNTASMSLGPLGTLLGGLANPATLVAGSLVAVGGALLGSAQAAAAWETSMSGVAKTSGLSGTALEGLSSQLLTMSTQMPITAKELADIASAGGSLGIGQAQADKGDYAGQAAAMAEFAEVASKMGIGFGMAADQAATAGAKILNSFGQSMDSSNLEKLGSVVNSMGDAFAATEPQVLDFLNRASFLNATMGQSIPQVAALGTTLISTGMDSEVAATGIKSFLNMATSATSKTGGMDNWAKLLGTSVDELKQKLSGDFNSTLIETANQIVAIEDPVERFQAAVALAGTEGAPAILKLAGQQDAYNKALGMTTAEWEKAQSLQKTYEAQSGTLNSQWTMFTNTIGMAATQLGTVMLPALSGALKVATELAKAGIEVGEKFSKATGIGQEGGLSAKLNSLTGGLLGLSVDQQKALDAQQELERKKELLSTESGRKQAEAEQKAKTQQERANEALALAEKREMGEKEAKVWVEAYGGAMEAGMTQVSEGVWKSWDAIADEHNATNYKYKTATGETKWGGGFGSEDDYAGLFGRGDVSRVTEDSGIKYAIRSHATKTDTEVSLVIDGQTMASGKGYRSQEEAITDLFNKGGFPLSDAVSLKLQNRPGEAAKVEMDKKIEIKFDVDAVAKNVAPIENAFGQVFSGEAAAQTLKGILQSYVDMAGESGKEAATKYAETFATGMASPDWGTLPQMQEAKDAIAKASPWEAERLNAQYKQYEQALLSQIADTNVFMKSEMKRMGSDAKSAFSDGLLNDADKAKLLGMEPELLLLKEQFPKEFEATGGEAALAMIDALKRGDIPGAMAAIGLMAGEEFKKNLVGGQAIELSNLAAFIEDPEKALEGITNVSGYIENAILPELTTSMGQVKGLIEKGVDPATIKANYIDPLESVKSYLPEWLQYLITALDKGQIDMKTFIEQYDFMMDRTAEKTEQASVGYNNLEKAIKSCADCATSEFGDWQEAQKDLFNPSYIGAGGEAYERFATQSMERQAATQRAMKNMGGIVTGRDVTGQEAVPTRLDTAQAMSDLTLLKSKITQEVVTPVRIDESAAMASIQAIDAAASAPVTKTVFIQEVNMKGGGGAGSVGAQSFANEGYVADSTLAVVGDRPGGEYVVGATKMDSMLTGIAQNTGDALPCMLNTERNTQVTNDKMGNIDNSMSRLETSMRNMSTALLSDTASPSGAWGSRGGTGGRYGSAFGDSWISGGAAGVGAGWDKEPTWGGEAASDRLRGTEAVSNKLDGIAQNTGDALPCAINTEKNTNATNTKLDGVEGELSGLEKAIQSMGSNIVSAMASPSNAWGGNGGMGGRYGSAFGNSWLSGGAAGVGAGWDIEPTWGGEAASDRLRGFAEGGFVDRPTRALVGDSPGGEWMVPNQDMTRLVDGLINRASENSTSMRVVANLSDADTAVAEWANTISQNPVHIPTKVDLDVDASELQALVVEALKKVVKNVRV